MAGERRHSFELLVLRSANRRELDRLAALHGDAVVADEAARRSYETVMLRFVTTQAPRLAAGLSDGDPCPVCGSTEHPAPAVDTEGEAVDHHAVDAAREVWAQCHNVVVAHEAAIAGVRESLGDAADGDINAMDVQVRDAETALGSAQSAVDELVRVRAEIATMANALDAAVASEVTKQLEVSAIESRAQTEREEADRLAGLAAHLDPATVDRHLAVHGRLATSIVGLGAKFNAVTSSLATLDAARSRLGDELAVSGYADVDAARSSLLSDDAERDARLRAEKWAKDVTEQQAQLRQLDEQGVPADRPHVDAAIETARVANEMANAAAALFTTAANALTAAGAELSTALDVVAGSADLRCERDTAKVVFKTCNGESGIKVKMERWVLAGELERVALAANAHLARMTNHRYTLHRSDVRGGLTLEVFDAHTGRSRATASLSGGEQFQASLSLALGLADVVSHGGTGSGRTFEALFVDEGFGSLDPNALDDAIAALAQLHAAGRTVGAITHVEAMKQQLHVGIEVNALADGRGSTLTVYP
jgi:exonuclease SbcC